MLLLGIKGVILFILLGKQLDSSKIEKPIIQFEKKRTEKACY
jgi:hypothetical protein